MIEKRKTYYALLGFWAESKDKDSKLPFPQASGKLDSKMAKKFAQYYESLSDRQSKCNYYKGSSTCRICGKANGSGEQIFRFESDSVVIYLYVPLGYRHYVEEHGVRPPLEFLKCLYQKKYKEATAYLRPIINIDENDNRILSAVATDSIIYLVDDSYKKDSFKWNSAIREFSDMEKAKTESTVPPPNTEENVDIDVPFSKVWYQGVDYPFEHLAECIQGKTQLYHLVSAESSATDKTLCGFRLPPFQRSEVWDTKRKIRLIESIFCEVGIGTILFVSNYDYPEIDGWLIDGQQRLTAIRDFVLGKFAVFGGKLSYNNMANVTLHFMGTDDLNRPKTANLIWGRNFLRCSRIEHISDVSVLKEVYNRLNFGGVPHKKKKLQ